MTLLHTKLWQFIEIQLQYVPSPIVGLVVRLFGHGGAEIVNGESKTNNYLTYSCGCVLLRQRIAHPLLYTVG